MKQLLKLCSLILAAGITLTGCEEPSSTSTPDQFQMGNSHGGGGGTADPVWVFPTSTFVKGKSLDNISVSDVDGSDRTIIYSSTGTNRVFFPTWSPTGASVSFVEVPAIISGVNGLYKGAAWGPYSIKAVDVTVTNGTVSSSNVRTIKSFSTSDSMRIVGQAWSPAAAKIVFVAYTPTQSRVYTINTDGSGMALIYSTTNTETRLEGKSNAWDSTGTEIAIAEYSGTSVDSADRTASLKIIDISGTPQRTVLEGYKSIGELQWSNGGPENISFEGSADGFTSSDLSKYIISSAANSTPNLMVANDWGGYAAFWSPDNSQLVYQTSTGYCYRYNVSSGAKTLVGQVLSGDWR